MKIKSKKSLEPGISDVIKKIRDFGGDRIKFIVLYGANNLGKSTQAKLLVEKLIISFGKNARR